MLTMIDNDPKFKVYDIPTDENILRVESEMQTRLDSVSRMIINKQKYQEKDTDFTDLPYIRPVNYLLERLVLLGMFGAEVARANDYFYSDPKCTGCGTCEKVCLSQKIEMIDKKPAWREDVTCYFCYTCLNYCPQQAVQIRSKIYMKSYTDKNGRYPHPFASIKDIAEQKNIDL